LNGIGQRIFRDFVAGRYFRIWLVQSAGIGDFIETLWAYRTALTLLGGDGFSNEMALRRTHYVVNSFVSPLIRMVEGVDGSNIHPLHDFSDKPKTAISPGAGDYLINLTDKGFAGVVNTFPASNVFSPFRTTPELATARGRSKYRFWVSRFAAGNMPVQAFASSSSRFDEFTSMKLTVKKPSEPVRLALFPFSRDGGFEAVTADPATGRSMSAEFVCEMAGATSGACVFGEPYHWLPNLSREIAERGASDHVWANPLPFAGMASAVSAASSVVTVDTSAAHLAAALGRRTVVLLDDRSPEVVAAGLTAVPRAPHVVPFICGLRERRPAELSFYRASILRILEKMGAKL